MKYTTMHRASDYGCIVQKMPYLCKRCGNCAKKLLSLSTPPLRATCAKSCHSLLHLPCFFGGKLGVFNNNHLSFKKTTWSFPWGLQLQLN